ncbi:MAG TPA: hypothetical protein ENK24_01695 [Anaerolineae bacterium]|nr:hypothetical protein [Anaerolineae bacterium]
MKTLKFYAVLLMILLLASVPIAAQEPVDNDFEIALSFHSGFSLAPYSDWFGIKNGGVDVAQNVPSGGRATTEFVVTDVEDLFFVNLAFDYDDAVVTLQAEDITPGSLFDGLTRGVDYEMLVRPAEANPRHSAEWPIPSFNPPPPGFNTTKRAYVNIYILNPNHPQVPIHGNGSLIKINWRVNNVAAGTVSPIDFTLANLQDEYGNYLQPCYPSASCDNALPGPVLRELPDPRLGWNFEAIGKLEVVNNTNNFQAALEGGRPALATTVGHPLSVSAVKSGLSFSGAVDAAGLVSMGIAPPYDQLAITRPGYLAYKLSGSVSLPAEQITLLAGDINGDDSINILDLALIANALNEDVAANPAAFEAMDYNNDSLISITDLALVAKNYGVVGPAPLDR